MPKIVIPSRCSQIAISGCPPVQSLVLGPAVLSAIQRRQPGRNIQTVPHLLSILTGEDLHSSADGIRPTACNCQGRPGRSTVCCWTLVRTGHDWRYVQYGSTSYWTKSSSTNPIEPPNARNPTNRLSQLRTRCYCNPVCCVCSACCTLSQTGLSWERAGDAAGMEGDLGLQPSG